MSRNVPEIFSCILQKQSIIQRSSDPEQARKIISTIDTTKHVITTQHIAVICLNRHDNQGLAPAPMKRLTMFLHLDDAVQHGHYKVSIRKIVTNVVVLAITTAQRLKIFELWIAFWVGKIFGTFLLKALEPSFCIGSPMFHAFTGCDIHVGIVFGGRGKKKKMHGSHSSILYFGCKTNTDNHWKWRGSWFCFMIAPVVRCLSMMLECNYLLREDKQLMHECQQQKLHLYNIMRAAHVPSWSLLHIGSSNNCFSRATIMHQVNGVGTRVLMGMHGKFTGQLYQRLHKLAENWYIWCCCKKGCRGHCKCQKAALVCTALCSCGAVIDFNWKANWTLPLYMQ